MRVEITEQQYRELSGTGVDVECKFYLVVNSAKTQVKCKSKAKRRSPLDIYRMHPHWEAIALSTRKQELMAGNCDEVLQGEYMASGELAERLAKEHKVTKNLASSWVSTMIKCGVLVKAEL